ncbi:MAG: DUF3179 domain-containing (seleno)protein [Cyclobacteriaceae bacterium]
MKNVINSVGLIVAIGLMVGACKTEKRDEEGHSHDDGKVRMFQYMNPHPELEKAYLFDREKIEKDGVQDVFNYISPLNEITEWTKAQEAKNVRWDDPITAFAVNGKYYVLPWYVMKNHHVGNLTIDGVEVVVTLCEVCSGSAAYSPYIDGKKLLFQLGGLYNGTNCMIDENGDVWGTFSGRAYSGPYKGRELERLQMFQGTWKEWIGTPFGECFVADYPDSARKGHGGSGRPGQAKFGFGKSLENEIDGRLKANTLVQGVNLNGEYRAYPHKVVMKKGVLEDTLGGESIVLLSIGKTSFMSCYKREFNGKLLSFELVEGTVKDKETGSVWQFDGRSTEGPMKGAQLTYVPNNHEEWYAWAAYHPETSIYKE